MPILAALGSGNSSIGAAADRREVGGDDSRSTAEQAGGPLRFCVWVGVPGGFAGMNRWRAKLLSKQTLVPCVAGILFILYTQKIN